MDRLRTASSTRKCRWLLQSLLSTSKYQVKPNICAIWHPVKLGFTGILRDNAYVSCFTPLWGVQKGLVCLRSTQPTESCPNFKFAESIRGYMMKRPKHSNFSVFQKRGVKHFSHLTQMQNAIPKKKNITMKTTVTLCILLTIFSVNTSAQDVAVSTLEGHGSAVNSVCFSPDGSLLASGSWDDTIRLWDVRTGKRLRTLTGHLDGVLSVCFSPDGNLLASGSWDDTIRLWDVRTGKRLRTLTGHKSNVNSVSFSPDGSLLASGSSDETIRLWELPDTRVRIIPDPVISPQSIGEQFTINVNVITGKNVGGYQVSLSFDTAVLSYVSSANGDYLPTGAFFVPPVVADNKVTLGATAFAGESNGDGTLATITFKVIDVKESVIYLFDTILTDSDGENLSHLAYGAIFEPSLLIVQLFGDVNTDGAVNILDLVLVASKFGQSVSGDPADVNEDGIVNIVDLVKVAGALGGEAAAPSVWNLNLKTAPTRADVQNWLSQAQQRNLTDAISQRGLRFLEQLLVALTPKETSLLPNYPNPFNPETWIPYQLAKASDVKISIYAADGKLVRTLALGHQEVGIYQSKSHAAYWDGRNAQGESVASGVYFFTLTAGDFTATRKLLIRK